MAMDRLSPTPATEPPLPESAGGSSLRTTAYAVLALLLAGGAWIRFNDQVATMAPALAAPAAGLMAATPSAARISSLLELSMVAPAAGEEATAELGLPASDSPAMAAALQRKRLRLVQLPLFDAGPADGVGTRTIQISTAGYTRVLSLSRTPQVVTLPIDRAGTIAFRVAGHATAGAVGIGALTATGPKQLPDLAPGQELDVGVIAQ